MLSCSNADTNNNDCCFASSAMIFWKTKSADSEIELKKVLTDLSIDYRDLDSQTWNSETSMISDICYVYGPYLIRAIYLKEFQ